MINKVHDQYVIRCVYKEIYIYIILKRVHCVSIVLILATHVLISLTSVYVPDLVKL